MQPSHSRLCKTPSHQSALSTRAGDEQTGKAQTHMRATSLPAPHMRVQEQVRDRSCRCQVPIHELALQQAVNVTALARPLVYLGSTMLVRVYNRPSTSTTKNRASELGAKYHRCPFGKLLAQLHHGKPRRRLVSIADEYNRESTWAMACHLTVGW